MKRILQSSVQRVEILWSHECDSADVPVEFADRLSALDFLRSFMHDPLNMVTLRSALAEQFPFMDILRLTDEEILQQFAWQITRRYFELVPRIEEPLRIIGPGTSSEADSEADSEASSGTDPATAAGATGTSEETPATSAAPTDTDTAVSEEETDWIEFRVVGHETDLPMSGIGLRIRLPTGEMRDYTTDSNGIVRIEDLSSGTCDILEITDPDAAEVVQME